MVFVGMIWDGATVFLQYLAVAEIYFLKISILLSCLFCGSLAKQEDFARDFLSVFICDSRLLALSAPLLGYLRQKKKTKIKQNTGN